ncbi:amino acid ABC transporter substrate-binding protein [Microbispora triticiradicis]|uniref:Amino acid ABC transporter substrate-binding protein n=3 Tax=Microbispora TaxID=2005 RepID=A0ABY3M530_9ACTN|nr:MULTISPECIES: ABC transporter substrate-binding protein [Microbispora]RGA02516.1 amino acid ABC transporter substrate-binding protein [Microbispora triticiradicis]TLP66724.1 amino acid ABC transporter substrate-binding protein [Microbispora fusca]TYB67460.1 amino acid ABC transporter substrate-binding protein [Microbispora tritici]GLW25650.1 amino acid ABC transporter substrate-binding protein [Microbispora amethystogenes]
MRRPSLLLASGALTLAAAACAPANDASTTASSSAGTSAGASTGADTCAKESLKLTTPGKLTIGTDKPAYEPWFKNDDPSSGQGFESAVAYAVAGQLGFTRDEVAWTVVPFDSSFAPGPKQFDFDVNQISITPERAKAVDFSQGYYTVKQGVVALEGGEYASATSLADLKDAKIGVQAATTALQAVRSVIQPAKDPSVFNQQVDAITALKNKQIDAIVVDLPTAFYVTAAQVKGSKIVGQFAATGGEPEEFGLLFQKGSSLVSCVDKALGELRSSGELAKIEGEWLTAAAGAPELK